MSHEPRDDSGLFADPDNEDAALTRRSGLLKRHPVLLSLFALIALAAVAVGGFAFYLNSQLGDVGRVSIGTLPDGGRPPRASTQAVNILLGGVDEGDGRTIQQIADGGWDAGVVRSDTIMVMHVTADREQAYLVSIPRDSYVTIYDENGEPQGKNKINAALSLYGPAAYVSTIEHLTDLRMDHLAIVDWAGFKDITDALGGVEIYLAQGFTDATGTTWEAGNQVLDGEGALKYVRTRYDLPNGDFGRISRQQNFIRALRSQALDAGTIVNPITLTNTVKAVVGNLTVDDEFDNGEIRSLAYDMSRLRGSDVKFLTAPFGSFDTTSAGASIVRLDEKQADDLWEAIREDDIDAYIATYGGEAGILPAPQSIN